MDEKFHEQAAAAEERARASGVAAAQRAAAGTGQSDCDDCGEPIAAARRIAYPAALRCWWCQTAHESTQRGLAR